MRYWWVNHDNKGDWEVAEGYLWSPQRSQTGARIQFYENMRLAQPGDAVLSCIDMWIRHVGIVTARAESAPKPSSYGAEVWNSEGWRLPVNWTPLPRAIQPRAHIDLISESLPQKYSPIRANGDRNQVYLAEIPEQVFDTLVQLGGAHAQRWKDPTDTLPPSGVLGGRVSERRRDYTYSPKVSERKQMVSVRIGQGLFRIRIRQFERGCRLTGITNPRLLVASHIKPWRVSTTDERLDGANGLLLAPHVDRLFDRGLICFEDSGEVRVSSKLSPDELSRLGLTEACAGNVGPFTSRQQRYLAHHRERVFKE